MLNQTPSVDIVETERFLKCLDPTAARFTFQTFDDDAERKDKDLVRIFNGTLAQHANSLKRLNDRGAGIFVTINETNLKGRKTENIIRVRALYIDLDGAPLDPVLNDSDLPKPHIVVASSPDRWHVYWLVARMALQDFEALQEKLIAKFNSDPSVHDLPRVMRLPGFWHRKLDPYLVKIISDSSDPPYDAKDFTAKLSSSSSSGEAKAGDDKKDSPHGFKAILSTLGDGPGLSGFHKVLRDAVASYVVVYNGAVDNETLKTILREAINKAPKNPTPQRVESIKRYLSDQYLDELIASAVKKFLPNQINSEVEKLNETHAFVIIGGTSAILKTVGRDISFLTVTAFDQWHANRHLVYNDKKVPLGKCWLTHPQRRQYQGLTFSPVGEMPGYFNLWRGFSVEPKPGDCSKFLAHIRDNVCCGDPDLSKWVIGWFAQIVQQPDKKMGTSLALRGKQGTGKTKVGEIFGSLFQQHYEPVSDPRYITGRFNSHLVSCLLLHADEGFWAGNKDAEGKLKDLVTGGFQNIEFKGKEPIRVRSYVRLLITGNSDWIVPAGFEERRFAVLDMGEDRMQDKPYFAAIDYEMDHGGREALLDHLLNFDLNSVDLRTIPRTAALLDQKVSSLTPEQGWWLDTLQRGELPWGCDETNSCPSGRLFDRYISRATRQGARRRSIEVQLGHFLLKHVPKLTKKRLTYQRWDGMQSDIVGMVYIFPSLKECREAFAKKLNQNIEWDEPEAGWSHEPPPDQGASF